MHTFIVFTDSELFSQDEPIMEIDVKCNDESKAIDIAIKDSKKYFTEEFYPLRFVRK